MLKFGFSALKAMPRFFAYRNDVDIYTEDNLSDKEFYKNLFYNLLGNSVLINDITPLGCKDNVLAAYDSRTISTRKQYFIVDGDLDLITDTNRKGFDQLIVLDSYCIENYLIDEEGALELIHNTVGTESKPILREKLSFESWIKEHMKPLIDLFLRFAILRNVGGGPDLKSAQEFIVSDGKSVLLDTKKIEEYTSHIESLICERLAEIGFETPNIELNQRLNSLHGIWDYSSSTALKIISGKNYLLTLLEFKINACCSKKSMFPRHSLKLFLAKHSSLSRLNYLKEIIVK